jgi:hypothetical protein
MTSGLRFQYLYHDLDVLEIQVIASNGRFMGTANIYVGVSKLSEFATK